MGSLSLLCCEMKVDCWPSFVCGILALFVLLLCIAVWSVPETPTYFLHLLFISVKIVKLVEWLWPFSLRLRLDPWKWNSFQESYSSYQIQQEMSYSEFVSIQMFCLVPHGILFKESVSNVVWMIKIQNLQSQLSLSLYSLGKYDHCATFDLQVVCRDGYPSPQQLNQQRPQLRLVSCR